MLVEINGDDMSVFWFTMLAFGPCRGDVGQCGWSLTDLDAATTSSASSLPGAPRQGARRPAGGAGGWLRRTSRPTNPGPRSACRWPWSTPDAPPRPARAPTRGEGPGRPRPDLHDVGGTAIKPRNVNRAWSALCDRAGMQVRIHDLRHAAASMAFAAGASVKEVQAMLRHSRESTTSDHLRLRKRPARDRRPDGRCAAPDHQRVLTGRYIGCYTAILTWSQRSPAPAVVAGSGAV